MTSLSAIDFNRGDVVEVTACDSPYYGAQGSVIGPTTGLVFLSLHGERQGAMVSFYPYQITMVRRAPEQGGEDDGRGQGRRHLAAIHPRRKS